MSRPHKYGAKPKTVDGIRFASTKEATRYQELKLLEKAGLIRNVVLQPRFVLWAWTQEPADAEHMPPTVGYYNADFMYLTEAGEQVIEDVKGFKTPLYKWKKRHVEAQYGIQIREI